MHQSAKHCNRAHAHMFDQGAAFIQSFIPFPHCYVPWKQIFLANKRLMSLYKHSTNQDKEAREMFDGVRLVVLVFLRGRR
uniref:Uncharacterized protein n=1 Tax=Caenorhabditis japonica TaxID=281687 RepID=A0A8R1I4W2_CAEJA